MNYKNNESNEYGGDDVTDFTGDGFYKLYSAYLKENGFKFDVTNQKFGREIAKYEGIQKKKTRIGAKYTINYDILVKYLVKMSYIEADFDEN